MAQNPYAPRDGTVYDGWRVPADRSTPPKDTYKEATQPSLPMPAPTSGMRQDAGNTDRLLAIAATEAYKNDATLQGYAANIRMDQSAIADLDTQYGNVYAMMQEQIAFYNAMRGDGNEAAGSAPVTGVVDNWTESGIAGFKLSLADIQRRITALEEHKQMLASLAKKRIPSFG